VLRGDHKNFFKPVRQQIPRVSLPPASLGLVNSDNKPFLTGSEYPDKFLVFAGYFARFQKQDDEAGFFNHGEGSLHDQIVNVAAVAFSCRAIQFKASGINEPERFAVDEGVSLYWIAGNARSRIGDSPALV